MYHKNPPTTLAKSSKRTTRVTKTVRKENFLFTPSAANIFYHKFLLRTLQPTRFGLKQQGKEKKKYYKQHNIPKKKHTFMISEARPHLIVLWEKKMPLKPHQI